MAHRLWRFTARSTVPANIFLYCVHFFYSLDSGTTSWCRRGLGYVYRYRLWYVRRDFHQISRSFVVDRSPAGYSSLRVTCSILARSVHTLPWIQELGSKISKQAIDEHCWLRSFSSISKQWSINQILRCVEAITMELIEWLLINMYSVAVASGIARGGFLLSFIRERNNQINELKISTGSRHRTLNKPLLVHVHQQRKRRDLISLCESS